MRCFACPELPRTEGRLAPLGLIGRIGRICGGFGWAEVAHGLGRIGRISARRAAEETRSAPSALHHRPDSPHPPNPSECRRDGDGMEARNGAVSVSHRRPIRAPGDRCAPPSARGRVCGAGRLRRSAEPTSPRRGRGACGGRGGSGRPALSGLDRRHTRTFVLSRAWTGPTGPTGPTGHRRILENLVVPARRPQELACASTCTWECRSGGTQS